VLEDPGSAPGYFVLPLRDFRGPNQRAEVVVWRGCGVAQCEPFERPGNK